MQHPTDSLTRYPSAELGALLLRHGRMPSTPEPTLFWTGSGITLVCRARELWIELDSAYRNQEDAIRITVNGYTTHRSVLSPGISRICVYRGLSADETHTVRLYKETQMSGEAGRYLRVTAVYTNGELLPVPLPDSLNGLEPIRFIAANRGVCFGKNSCNIRILLQIFALHSLTICSL